MNVENRQISLESLINGVATNEVQSEIVQTYYDHDIGRNKRDLFQISYHGESFRLMFYSPNELPTPFPIAHRTVLFGQKPRLRTDNAWEGFLSDVARSTSSLHTVTGSEGISQTASVQDALMVVESSPLSLIRIAHHLLPDNAALANAEVLLSQRHHGQFFREFVDNVLAGKFIDEFGIIKKTPDYEGELLMVKSLLGDREAAIELSRRREILKGKDRLESDAQEVNLDARNEHGFGVDDLVAVHATDFAPVVGENGRVYIRSYFEGSDYTETRSSIHFALNHLVSSHSGFLAAGMWDDKKYTIITPLRSLWDANGQPESLRAEDTYFETSPGKPLELPANTVIVTPTSGLRELPEASNKLPYNDVEITASDLRVLEAHWQDLDWGPYYRNKYHYNPNDRFLDVITLWEYNHPSQFDTLSDYISTQIQNKIHRYERGNNDESKRLIPGIFRALGGRIRPTKRAEESGLRRYIFSKFPSNDSRWLLGIKESDIPIIAQQVDEEVGAQLAILLKKISVNATIRSLGFEVEEVDPSYLEKIDYGRLEEDVAPPFAKEVVILAKAVGISSQRHVKMTETDSEIAGQILARRMKQYDQGEVDDNLLENYSGLRSDLAKDFPYLNPKSRRMYYMFGAF